MEARRVHPPTEALMWGVFAGGTTFGPCRSIEAMFWNRDGAVEWAKAHKKEHGRLMMVEEVKVDVPAWDGKFPSQEEFS